MRPLRPSTLILSQAGSLQDHAVSLVASSCQTNIVSLKGTRRCCLHQSMHSLPASTGEAGELPSMSPYACSKGGHLQRKGFPCIYGFSPFHITKEGVGQCSSNVRAKLLNASERVCKREGLTSPGLGSTASTVELGEACSRERATAEDSYCLAWKSVWGTRGHG